VFKIQDGFWLNLVKRQTKLLKLKTFEYQVVRDHQDPNFLYIPFFHLRKFNKHYSLNLESHINYMKLYVRIADFHQHLPNTLSNAKMLCILNVDLDEWNNIGIHDFSG